jgi:Glyoxalase-like domain
LSPFEGGAAPRRPRLEFDHVQIAVHDLDEAANRFARDYGLLAVAGGRHPGRGTGNAIVPLGGSYLELIAVVDDAEAERHPTSVRVRRALETGRTFAGWAARTEDLGATLANLRASGFDVPEGNLVEGRRQRPDGTELSWRSAELVPGGVFTPLPFLIEWQVPAALFPGAGGGNHPSGARGVLSTRLSDPEPDEAFTRVRQLLADDLQCAVQQGLPGVAEIVVDAPAGPLTLR